MLTKRIIPCLDVDRGRVVKGTSFVALRDAGDPAEMAALYDREGADELVFLDITASAEERKTMIEVVRHVSEQVFIPLTVGGGIRTVEDISAMLLAGADKVSLNTVAVQHPQRITDGATRFGSQCIVVAIDAKRVAQQASEDASAAAPAVGRARAATTPSHRSGVPPERWDVFTHGGRTATGKDVIAWAKEAVERGAGEILLTSMDEDGRKNGYDLALTRAVSEAVTVPVIASGGAGDLAHFYDGLTSGKADAVLAASVFHYGTFRIAQVKDYLAQRGLPVRR